MIGNDRVTDYINSLERSRGTLLSELASKARKERVPVIREETASFLISLVEAKGRRLSWRSAPRWATRHF